MDSPGDRTDADRFFGGRTGVAALAVAYVGVGVGLVYSLATGSTEAFVAVLGAILALMALSLYVLYRREGLLTAENAVIGVFVLLAVGLLVGLGGATDLPTEIVLGVVLLVGVIVPGMLVEYADVGDD